MASSTDFWFEPDAEFYAAVEDNVVVGQTTSMTRQGLQEGELFSFSDTGFDGDNLDGDDLDDDHASVEQEERPANLRDILTNTFTYGYGNALGLETDTQLLYADVDNHDPSELDINKRVAKAGFLEEESGRLTLVKANLIGHLATLPWPGDDFWSSDPDLDYEESDEEGTVREKRQQLKKAHDKRYSTKKEYEMFENDRLYIERIFEREYGLLSPDKVDYILCLEKEEDRREVLTVCSNQTKRKLRRPVVLLIGAIEKPSREKPETKEGWAVVYDFFNNHITIKPYLMDKTHHPLAQKWDSDIPSDGVCLTGHPAVFVDKILQLEAEIKAGINEAHTAQVLVYYLVARWLILHWKALSAIKVDGQATMTDEELEKVSDAKRYMLHESAKIELPQEKPQTAPGKSIRVFEHLQAHLEDYEAAIRKEAVKAKKAGNETAAEDAVKLYDKLTGMLQEFNMNADKDV
ncbi:MAG: hypothetical protein L6R41_007628 [Letrouitia leprolyta]|nr:MAG: hypothetical protein L6R41_007628 [Letrouitia leprolyta]